MSAASRIADRADLAELDRAETLLQDAQRALRELQAMMVPGCEWCGASLAFVTRMQRTIGAAPVAS